MSSLSIGYVPVVEAFGSQYFAYKERYHTLRATYAPLAHLFRGKRVLDFGCGRGLSACVLMELGAQSVVGVDALAFMIQGWEKIIRRTEFADRIELMVVEDTRHLPFESGEFGAVVCNAVFEHIPQPRYDYIREVWRMVGQGGHLIINETPNKYLPVDFHTLHLPLTNWLPSSWAHWIGVKTGRFRATRSDWQYSGWRGAGYYEIMEPIEGGRAIPELANARHRLLNRIGLPSGLFDPYPLYVIERIK